MKQCSRCKETKPLSSFTKHRGRADGLSSRCRPCARIIARFQLYGISEIRYLALLEQQGGVCAICRGPEPRYEYFPVDHDHATGQIRGLLCSNCNPLLGYAKDSRVILQAAIDYLEKERA